nr:MAG TPA: hypothetical protein [Caudoviricetes sp.]
MPIHNRGGCVVPAGGIEPPVPHTYAPSARPQPCAG